MDELLMLCGQIRHCADCGRPTVFLPVEKLGWICTACDAAVVLPTLDDLVGGLEGDLSGGGLTSAA